MICKHCNGKGVCDCNKCGKEKFLKSGTPYWGSDICKNCFGKSTMKNTKPEKFKNKSKNVLAKKLDNIFPVILGIPFIVILFSKWIDENTYKFLLSKIAWMIPFFIVIIAIWAITDHFLTKENIKGSKPISKEKKNTEAIKFTINSTKNLYEGVKFTYEKIYSGKYIKNGNYVEFIDDSGSKTIIQTNNINIKSINTDTITEINDVFDIF